MDIKRNMKNAQKYLGIDKLRKHKVKPIDSIQVPALIFSGMTPVIEPTLSLMYDQVNKLKAHGINAQ